MSRNETRLGSRARERDRLERERLELERQAAAEAEAAPAAPIADELATAAATAIEAADRRRRRDQIMCAALTGLLADSDGPWPTNDVNPDHDPRPVDHRRRELTLRAWQIADAALATEPDLKS